MDRGANPTIAAELGTSGAGDGGCAVRRFCHPPRRDHQYNFEKPDQSAISDGGRVIRLLTESESKTNWLYTVFIATSLITLGELAGIPFCRTRHSRTPTCSVGITVSQE